MTRAEVMTALAECRQRIDAIDEELVRLLNDRTRIVEEIGRLKNDLGLPIYEPRREDEVYANILRHNRGPLGDDGVRRIYERLIDEMRNVQRLRMIGKGTASPEPAKESE